ncbi:MAG TPA: deoxyguanosinetriphosphate triphosphohydrolase [Oscillospiraceae bacterium]|nr:deoxyguanosinetriphosphate triphosphohydrolase [Oscillospiraceae bacterium]HPS33780.1 deoxyguanosinetriphosphate triphosphohydrolase [Oscillospiraceae bacterium]
MTIREELEQKEHLILAPNASFADQSKGRQHNEKPCDYRTDFQRDTDRIVHSSSFSRLKQKTQVFLSPRGDHYTTRMTHTIQVAMIARTMARAMSLNENLTEAIAMGHDVGHTPFGHAGESALSKVLKDEGVFRHYEHSVRVLQCLEKDGKGLNLTAEVVDGIINHTAGKWSVCLEGRLVRIADRIAYVNHDIEDAVRAEIIKQEDVPIEIRDVLGPTKSARITTLVAGVIKHGVDCEDPGPGSELNRYFDKLHEFMFERVYTNPKAKSEESKAKEMIETLYEYFYENPEELTKRAPVDREHVSQSVVDYIAGMTDRYAVSVFEEVFVPRGWGR